MRKTCVTPLNTVGYGVTGKSDYFNMKYIKIVPEIVLSIGDRTVFINDNSNDEIIKLHINLENWLGDDLLWNFPEVIVTKKLKEALEKTDFTGFEFDKMEVTKDVYFYDNYKLKKPLPKFYWMKVTGNENKDDIFLQNWDLYISERLLIYLKDNHNIDNAEINPVYDKDTDDFIMSLIQRDNGL